MCGIFGFIGKRLDVALLADIALATEAARGGDAWGMAWVDGKTGALRRLRSPGRLLDSADAIRQAKGAIMVIGHCRWATRGSPAENENNHPHACGTRGFLVHNGTIGRHAEIAKANGLKARTACDSEVLGLLFAKYRQGDRLDRFARACSACSETALGAMGIWHDGLIVARAGKPLAASQVGRSAYLASLTDHLPCAPEEVPDSCAFAFSPQGRVLRAVRILRPKTGIAERMKKQEKLCF